MSFKNSLADGIELDVHMSKDGVLVVIHDERIDRTSNGSGYVIDYTLEELKKFDFSKPHTGFNNVKIPTLEEVYTLLKPTNLTINVELKTGIINYIDMEKKLIELEEKISMEGRIIYSSFNHYALMELRKHKPDVKIGLLYSEGFIDVPIYGKNLGANALHPNFYNLFAENFIEQCKDNILDINVWTIDREDFIKQAVLMGVNSIITNKPDVALNAIKSLS